MTGVAQPDDPWVVVESVAAGLAALLVVAAAPFAAGILHAGAVADLNVVQAAVGTVRVAIEGRWDDPAAAFPVPARDVMPAAAGWWAAFAWTAAIVGCIAAGIWRRADAHISQASLARRPYEFRGSRQRTWARPRDMNGAIHGHRKPGRFTLGHLDRRLVLSDPESHVALVAPTRSGKTTRYVIPWLLEHEGPAVVTSTKLDVVQATDEARRRRGQVWIWDPFGKESATWNPLRGCANWSYALAQAQWIADSSGEGDSEIAAYWRGEAAKLLAPFLHAAALDGKGMSQVLAWVDAQNARQAGAILQDGGRIDACRQLTSIGRLDARNRGTTYMSAGSLLAAYRYPELDREGPELELPAFLDGRANTVYIVAGARHQRLLAPLVVGLLSSILHEAAERTRVDKALQPTLRLLLDEAANIAPIRDLPAHLSQAAGNGVRIATIWQSLAQLNDRYRAGANGILANSTTKVFMGPVTDDITRRYVQGLVGEEPHEVRSRTDQGALEPGRSSRTRSTASRQAVSALELQQLGVDRALVVEGRSKPAVVRTTPWWRDAW